MKGLVTHAVLAVGGLLLAYVVWTSGDGGDGPGGQVTVLDCEPEEVGSVRLDAEDFEVELTERKGDEGSYWWVRHVSKKVEGRPPERQFAANEERVADYLELVAPLRATRRIGEMDEKTREEVGLGKGADRIAVACDGEKHAFRAGDNAYGSGDRYLRDERGGAVYLVDANIVRDLQSAQIRIMQRQLPAFDWKDVVRLHVKAHGEERTLLQRNRQNPAKAQWVDAAKPDRRNELYGNWLSRVRRMSVREYLPPGEKPGGAGQEVTPVARFRFEDADGEILDRWEMVRVVGEGTVDYYARSEATRGWVELPASVARQVARDARPVVGLEAVEEPRPEPPERAPQAAEQPGAEGEGEGAEQGAAEDDAASETEGAGRPGAPPGGGAGQGAAGGTPGAGDEAAAPAGR